jgi:hypothetical protein
MGQLTARAALAPIGKRNGDFALKRAGKVLEFILIIAKYQYKQYANRQSTGEFAPGHPWAFNLARIPLIILHGTAVKAVLSANRAARLKPTHSAGFK